MPNVVTINSNAFISRFHVKPECKQQFAAAFDTLWRGAEGFMNEHCHFVFYGWDRTGRIFYAIESWKDENVTAALRQSDEFKSQVGTLMGYCDAPMEMELVAGIETDASVFTLYPQGESQVHPRGTNGLGAIFL